MQNHDGTEADPGAVFFAEAPAAIGRVVSGSTSERALGRAPAPGWGGAVMMAAAPALVSGIAVSQLLTKGENAWSPSLLIGGVPVFLCVLWLARSRPKVCSYLGTDGMAIVRSRFGMRSVAVYRFAGAVSVDVGFTRGFGGNGYTGTAYSYDWKDGEGRILFSIRGSFDEHRVDRDDIDEAAIRRLPVDDLLHLARAAHARGLSK